MAHAWRSEVNFPESIPSFYHRWVATMREAPGWPEETKKHAVYIARRDAWKVLFSG